MDRQAEASGSSGDPKDARLLVVDDEPANIRLLDRILHQGGYANVRSTTDAREVLGLVATFEPDLVLLDLLMPHVDGYAVMEEIRERAGPDVDLSILVLTADTTIEARHRSLSAGATDFLTKPFDQVEVLLRIGNLLRMHFLHLQLRIQNEHLEAIVDERTRDLRRSIDDLRATDRQRRALLSRLVQAQEDERLRIAGDIHDDPVQKMSAVLMRLELLRRRVQDPGDLEVLAQLAETVRASIRSLRLLLFELRPPALDRDGLARAIAQFAERSALVQDVQLSIENQLVSEPPVDPRIIAYRIVQEALTNVRKHARARRVRVSLSAADEGLRVVVKDDGVGLPADTIDDGSIGHLGLTTMRERAELAGGWFRIHGAEGAGTSVDFWLPVHARKIPSAPLGP
ncbi:MAG: response regulator [Candidatus Velamenicoccus archaeovorus]